MLSKNVINEVMKEWSWRVSTGMPDITKTEDLKLLREVLIDDFNLSVYDANKIIEGLSKVKYINLSYAALAMGKSTQLNGFLHGITTEAAKLIKPTLDTLEAEQIHVVASLLSSFKKEDFGSDLGLTENMLKDDEVKFANLTEIKDGWVVKQKKENANILLLNKKMKPIDKSIVDKHYINLYD